MKRNICTLILGCPHYFRAIFLSWKSSRNLKNPVTSNKTNFHVFLHLKESDRVPKKVRQKFVEFGSSTLKHVLPSEVNTHFLLYMEHFCFRIYSHFSLVYFWEPFCPQGNLNVLKLLDSSFQACLHCTLFWSRQGVKLICF